MMCTTCNGEGTLPDKTQAPTPALNSACPACKGTNDPGSYLALLRQALDKAEEDEPGFTRDLLLELIEGYYGPFGDRTDRRLPDGTLQPPLGECNAYDLLGGILKEFAPDELEAPVVVDYESCEECNEWIPAVHGGGLCNRYHAASCSLHDPEAR